MNLRFTDYNSPCTSFSYNDVDHVFNIFDENGNCVTDCISPLDLNQEFDYKNFELHLLKNDRKDFSENSIYQVKVDEVRIGWIFPLQALLSDQHDFATNKFFLNYAYVAYNILLDRIHEQNQRESNSTLLLSDYYDINSVLLLIDKENILNIDGFDINNYWVSLFMYGYSCFGHGNCISESVNIDKHIHLKSISNDLNKSEYINLVFLKNLSTVNYHDEEDRLYYENERVYVFHTLYQIIELMISIILDIRIVDIVNEIHDNPTDLFNIKEELNEVSKEGNRIAYLFSTYTNPDKEDCSVLRDLCIKFLSENNEKIKKENVSFLLYQVRCLIFHKMYSVDESSLCILEDINKVFTDIVLDMIISFESKPL